MPRPFLPAALLSAALPLLAADAGALAVKPGLWETQFETSTPGTAGRNAGPSMPSGANSNMPSGMREHMDKMGTRTAPRGPVRKFTERACVTAEQLQKDVFRPAFPRGNLQCDYQLVAATPQRQEVQMTCPAEPRSSGRMEIEVVDDANARGTMNIQVEPANVKLTFKSRWLGAACDEGVGG